MLSRISFLAVLAVALVALAGPSLRAAEEKAQEATVVKAGDGKITLTFKGVEGKHNHDVAKDAKITLDDKQAKLEELKEGVIVNVTMDDKFVVTKIDARSKKKAVSSGRLLVQEPSTMPDGEYDLACAKSCIVHANDSAILLRKYAEAHNSMPMEVLKEQCAAMGFHLQAARNSFTKLAATAKAQTGLKNPAELLKHVEMIDKRLAMLNDSIKKLEKHSGDVGAVIAQTTAITKELAASNAAARSADEEFYDSKSSTYYETGLGHFVD